MTQNRQLTLEWCDRNGRTTLVITGWTGAELEALRGPDGGEMSLRLALFPSEALGGGDGIPGVPAAAGRFEVEGEAVWFVPRFPFVDGMEYSLALFREAPEQPETWRVRRPAKEVTPTGRVTAIYPDAGEVPLNLLKIYVHFSEPMSEGWGDRAIRVCRAEDGEPLEGVFLPMEPELWDRERRRLTLLLDPGRIKRGLAPNLEAGYPLTEEVPFRLAIDPAFRDAQGKPLVEGAERVYGVGPAIRKRINPMGWKVGAPPTGSGNPLLVGFARPLDHALLQHSLWVKGPDGEALAGEAVVGPGETSWVFRPAMPWQTGTHHLMVEPVLEDLAGNSPVRVFDRDITEEDDLPEVAGRLGVPFECR